MHAAYILVQQRHLRGRERGRGGDDLGHNLPPGLSQNKSNDMQIIFNSFGQENDSILIYLCTYIYKYINVHFLSDSSDTQVRAGDPGRRDFN